MKESCWLDTWRVVVVEVSFRVTRMSRLIFESYAYVTQDTRMYVVEFRKPTSSLTQPSSSAGSSITSHYCTRLSNSLPSCPLFTSHGFPKPAGQRPCVRKSLKLSSKYVCSDDERYLGWIQNNTPILLVPSISIQQSTFSSHISPFCSFIPFQFSSTNAQAMTSNANADVSPENLVVRFSEAVDGFPLPKGHSHSPKLQAEQVPGAEAFLKEK